MDLPELLFWIALICLAFVGLLGVQLRYFGGLGLRVFVNDRLRQASRTEVSAVILAAVGGPRAQVLEKAEHARLAEMLQRDYPGALGQIRLGRKITLYVPFIIALALVARRFLPF